MSKQKPEYYKLPSGGYLALNRSPKRMFKKQGINYRIPGKLISINDYIKEKEKGLKYANKKKKVK